MTKTSRTLSTLPQHGETLHTIVVTKAVVDKQNTRRNFPKTGFWDLPRRVETRVPVAKSENEMRIYNRMDDVSRCFSSAV